MTPLYAMAPPSGQQGGGGIMSFLPLILIFVIFYLFLILPQKQQKKKHAELLENLKRGGKVVTSGGIHGTITKLEENTVTLQLSQKAEMTVDRSAISRILS
jgi:preprotein translocase subunit YajC